MHGVYRVINNHINITRVNNTSPLPESPEHHSQRVFHRHQQRYCNHHGHEHMFIMLTIRIKIGIAIFGCSRKASDCPAAHQQRTSHSEHLSNVVHLSQPPPPPRSKYLVISHYINHIPYPILTTNLRNPYQILIYRTILLSPST